MKDPNRWRAIAPDQTPVCPTEGCVTRVSRDAEGRLMERCQACTQGYLPEPDPDPSLIALM